MQNIREYTCLFNQIHFLLKNFFISLCIDIYLHPLRKEFCICIFCFTLSIQQLLLETKKNTLSYWEDPSTQHSEYMYLDKGKNYYYKAYFASGWLDHSFKLGLFGQKTAKTETDYPDIARDEKQTITVTTADTPLVQVS